MLVRSILILSLICGCAASARAADETSLPILALDPPASPAAPSPWSGLYVGSEIFAVSGLGKGSKGGVGGAMDFGYNHEFANNVVIGVNAAMGYAPSLYQHSPYTGFDTAVTNLKLGYNMGRLMPYVTTGVILEKPHTGPGGGYTGASDAINGLFVGSSNLKAAATVGAGFDYAVTDKLTVGVGVAVSRGQGFIER